MRAIAALLHAAAAALLLAAHCIFFFRGLSIQAGRFPPRRIDHLARSLAQALLPITAAAGLAVLLSAGRTSWLPHPLLGLAPLVAVPLLYFGRLALRKKTQAPWLLPLLNLILIVAAAVTGLMFGR